MKLTIWVAGVVVAVGLAAMARVAEASSVEAKPLIGADNATNTVITSDLLSVDYRQNVAVFEGNVEVEHGDIKLKADHMTVSLSSDKTITSISCKGNVRIWQRDRFATADRAIYVERTGQVNLIGSARVEQRASVLMGDRITFWRHEDRMECEPGFLRIMPGAFDGTDTTPLGSDTRPGGRGK